MRMSMSRACHAFRRPLLVQELNFCSRWTVSLLLVLALSNASPCIAVDTVIVSRAEGRRQARRVGRIIEYTGDMLLLEAAGGRQEKIPSERVIAIETAKVPDQKAADQFFSEGRYAEALTLYRRAVREESRTWMRREIIAEMVRCHVNLGQMDQACETFLVLVHSDPNTLWFDAIPLAWIAHPVPPELDQLARKWLAATEKPVATLLAASWLLATSERSKAIKTLRQLALEAEPRVARLARAQLWRTEIMTASIGDVRQWRIQLAKMPRKLRAGPTFVLARALARHQQHLPAALVYMRVPILHARQRELAAESLLAAGEQLQKANVPDEAKTVYQELIRQYPGHSLVPTARQRLETLDKRSADKKRN